MSVLIAIWNSTVQLGVKIKRQDGFVSIPRWITLTFRDSQSLLSGIFLRD